MFCFFCVFLFSKRRRIIEGEREREREVRGMKKGEEIFFFSFILKIKRRFNSIYQLYV